MLCLVSLLQTRFFLAPISEIPKYLYIRLLFSAFRIYQLRACCFHLLVLLPHILGHVPTRVLYITEKFLQRLSCSSGFLTQFQFYHDIVSILSLSSPAPFCRFASLWQLRQFLHLMSPHAEFIKTQSRKSKPFTSASAFPLRTQSCVFLFFMLQISLNRCFLLLLFSIFLFLNDKGSFKTRCLSKERVVEDIPSGLSHCAPNVVRIFLSDYKM